MSQITALLKCLKTTGFLKQLLMCLKPGMAIMELLVSSGKPSADLSQKCHLHSNVMEKLGAAVTDFALIQTEKKCAICSLWPLVGVCEKMVNFSETVVKQNSINCNSSSNTDKNCDLADPENKIKLISTCKADTVTVGIIMKDVSSVQKYFDDKQNQRLQSMCHNCLKRVCIAKGFYVNCEEMRLARLYGISGFEIKDAVSRKDAERNFDGFVVGQGTKVVIESVHSKDWFLQQQVRDSQLQIGGLDDVVQTLTDLVKIPLQHKDQFLRLGVDPPQGILLRGPPGCGKTSLVKYVAAETGAFLLAINGPEVFGPHPGETESNIRSIFQKAKVMCLEGPCILFIDEIDSVCPKKTGQGGVQEARVTGQLLTALDGVTSQHNIVVIGATNRPAALDPAVRRPGRLDREILISVPTRDQRQDILCKLLSEFAVADAVEVDILADMTNGWVGADLKSLCQEAAYLAMTDHRGHSQGSDHSLLTPQLRQEHLLLAVKKICPSLQRGGEGLVDLRPVHWGDIGGLESVKAQVKQTVEWPLQHPEAFERMGLPCPKGVLLYGPPGCCKTTLVRAAATSCHTTFLSLSGAQLYSPYVGDSERMITEVFQRARASAPSIIFLDEIDSIVGKRSESSQRGVQERLLSVLLNEMDGVGIKLDDKTDASNKKSLMEMHSDSTEKNDMDPAQRATADVSGGIENRTVLVVAATNRPDLLDEALVRPGRIDRMVYVPPPDKQARLEIFRVFTRAMCLMDVDLETLAEMTEMYTGADIENLCREAALAALTEDLEARKVTAVHFDRACNSVKPSLNQQLIQQYSNVNVSDFKAR